MPFFKVSARTNTDSSKAAKREGRPPEPLAQEEPVPATVPTEIVAATVPTEIVAATVPTKIVAAATVPTEIVAATVPTEVVSEGVPTEAVAAAVPTEAVAAAAPMEAGATSASTVSNGPSMVLASTALFDKFDANKNGQIGLAEAVDAMAELLGHGPLAQTFVTQFTKYDADASGALSREEFHAMYLESPAVVPSEVSSDLQGASAGDANLLTRMLSWAIPEPSEEERTRARGTMAFNKYDLDGDGKIEMIEALRAMKELVGPLAKHFVSHYTKADKDGSGYLDSEEFYLLYSDLMSEAGKSADDKIPGLELTEAISAA